ncbi:hypothetical protein HWV07_15425 [Natronomonas salina]|uniref:hypothetical protein n=1 Tax=Natronomonas salina TaxID=1710540 RepID=UPI0015B5D6F8|nr:hypothetical protein [Natronomonas salina]QLD90350.1 hypothetical protein HWV07_15425 [Natronomonas salina]
MLAGCSEESPAQKAAEQTPSDPPNYARDSGSTPKKSSDTTPEPTPLNPLERRKLLRTYNDGVDAQNNGMRARERGVDSWNNDAYGSAKRTFASAEEDFRKAKDEFQDAEQIAFEINHRQAQEFCDVAIEYTSVWIDAMRASQRMASAGSAGNGEEANRHLETIRQLEREAGRINIRNTTTLEAALDLD